MARTPKPSPPSHSIVVADCVGRGHVTVGLRCHDELKVIYARANQAGTAVDVTAVLNLAIAAITNLALGLEIFLKMHHFQQSGGYPSGHDIGNLATSFNAGVQQALRGRFKEMLQHDAVQSAPTLKIAVGEEQQDFAANWPEEVEDLDSAAILLGRAYERWRYIYEELNRPLVATISFKPLIAMVFTFDSAIRDFRSGAFVSVGENAT